MSSRAYPTDLTDEQWVLVEPLLNHGGKRGPRFGSDVREVMNAMLYVAHTGCQWRYLPEEFGPWNRVWSQFRRWSRNGAWARVLLALHQKARLAAGRDLDCPSMVVIDTHLARGASNGGATFHDRGGPYGMTKGAKRVIAVDVTGLPVAAQAVPASTSEGRASEDLVAHMSDIGAADMLELLLVDRGTDVKSAARIEEVHGIEVRRVGWDDKSPVFRPIAHAWRVEVAHGRLGRSRRLAKSFENTLASATGWLQVACIATVLVALTG